MSAPIAEPSRRLAGEAGRAGHSSDGSAREAERQAGAVDSPVELDVRLAVGAAAAWLAVLVALSWSSAAVLYAAVIAVALGMSCAALAVRWHHDAEDADAVSLSRSRAGATASITAMAALCCAVVLLALAADLTRTESGPVHTAAVGRLEASFEATVSADPRPIGAAAFGGSRVVVDARLRVQRSGRFAHRVNVAVVVLANGADWTRLEPGQRIRFDGRSAPPQSGTLTAATIHARGSPVRIGRPPALQRLASTVRDSLRRACRGLPEPERGLLPGLVDGDTAGLDPTLKQQFRVAGLTHLVAVSGTNAAILIGVVLLVLRRLRTPPWLAAAVGAVCLVLFVLVARPSPSVLRAAVMAGVLLVSLATGRPRQGLPALAFAVLVLLTWHPDWARNAGFAMSTLATGALLVIAPGWVRALRDRHFPIGIAEGVAVAAAATAVSAPIIVLLSGQVSLVSLPANLLAEVAVAPATVLGVLTAATAPWAPGVAACLAYLASWPCRWLVGVAQFFGTLPGATVSWPRTVVGAVVLAAVTALCVSLIRHRRWRPLLLAAALTAVFVQIPVRSVTGGWPARGAIFVVCDVGQGDAVVLPTGHHTAVVMDAGPEPVSVDRCLRSLGITTVTVYIQSHYHLDHVGGIAGLVHGRRIGRVYASRLTLPEQGHRLLTEALAPLGIVAQVASVGTTIDAGPVHLEVLSSRVITVDAVGDPNESSLVLRATVGGHSILLTGDASTQAQQDLLDSHAPIAAEILKVPHHGSAYFTPAFMAAVHPRLGVISVGAHNSYGHPALRLVDDLLGLGVALRRTDQDGDVAVVAAAHGIGIQLHRTSTAAHGPVPGGARAETSRPELSAGRATMDSWPTPTAWQRVRAASSSSSVTRSFSSAEPSSRSPPSDAVGMPRPTSSTASVLSWPPQSCTSC